MTRQNATTASWLAHSGTDQPVNAQGLLHPIHIFNDNYYLYAREGDTFKASARKWASAGANWLSYNERDKHDVLHKGDIIYLKKKRKKAPKQYKKRPHVVQPGESMYSHFTEVWHPTEEALQDEPSPTDYKLGKRDKAESEISDSSDSVTW